MNNKESSENRESKYAAKLLKRKRLSRKLGYRRILTVPELKLLGAWKNEQ